LTEEEDIRRLKDFEMWVWRRMEKISWRYMKQMKRYYNRYKKKRSLMDLI